VAVIGTGRGELAEFVTDHFFRNGDGDELLPAGGADAFP